ncbi:hypothetical protein E5288_WYG019317 [Bos mutus]|uniref:Uncharacterized protein n=1 Tax=Bos mutus TaxID=72004 RepID=A0A6B0RG14_9CETA|nr:hypothetical protein [Bos mutus]
MKCFSRYLPYIFRPPNTILSSSCHTEGKEQFQEKSVFSAVFSQSTDWLFSAVGVVLQAVLDRGLSHTVDIILTIFLVAIRYTPPLQNPVHINALLAPQFIHFSVPVAIIWEQAIIVSALRRVLSACPQALLQSVLHPGSTKIILKQ